MYNYDTQCNTYLNSDLSYDELEAVISKLKNNKATMMLLSHFSDFSQRFLKVVSYQPSGKK